MRWIFGILMLALVSPAWAEPRKIAHRYGVTEIDGTPQRVVSVSLIGHDFLLALGVKPVALRHWFGTHEFGVWPWAQEALGEAEPTVLYGDIDIERIALLKPDLIVGQWSGMSEAEYNLLSQIAPTVPPAAGETDYSSSWQVMTRQLGLALGKEDQARMLVSDLEDRFAAIRTAHPEWQGQSAVVAWPPRIGVFTSLDLRSRFLQDLGFASPQAVDDLPGSNAFYITLPQENVAPIDTDVIVWVYAANLEEALGNIILRKTMRAYREGRELHASYDLTAALAHSSPLSLTYALDQIVPLIEQAADGDPLTPVDGFPQPEGF